MDIETLRTVAADLLGNGWQTRLARATGIDGSTVRRWLANGVEAPGPVAAFLQVLGDRQETRGALLFHKHSPDLRGAEFTAGEPATLEHMAKRLSFPGVDQLKPMPAIHVAFDAAGTRTVHLDGAASDRILDTGCYYRMVRHPDGRHLKGYVDVAEGRGLAVAVATHRFHHYTLTAHRAPPGPCMIGYTIATHQGQVRSIQTTSDDPATTLGTALWDILGNGET